MRARMSLAKRIACSFFLVSLVSLATAGVVLWRFQGASGQIKERLEYSRGLLAVSDAIHRTNSAQLALLNASLDADLRKERYAIIEEQTGRSQRAISENLSIDQDEQERVAMEGLVASLAELAVASDEFLLFSKQLDTMDLYNPVAVNRHLDNCLGDHNLLVIRCNERVSDNRTFKGGEEASDCPFGEWLPSFTTANPDIEAHRQAMIPLELAFHEGVARLKQMCDDGQRADASDVVRQTIVPAQKKIAEHIAEIQKITCLAESIHSQMTDLAIVRIRDCQAGVQQSLDRLVALNEQLILVANQGEMDARSSAKLAGLSGSCAAVLLSLVLGYLLTVSTAGPISKSAHALLDECSDLAMSSSQIAGASNEVAEGAKEQSASLASITASMADLYSMTQANAANTRDAEVLIRKVVDAVDRGREKTRRMVESIEHVRVATGKTKSIIDTFDSISFQTNLLALNAAVEAARVGEAGKGFGVVAEEVRRLSQRSAEASKSIVAILDDVVQRVEEESAIGADVREGFVEIDHNAKQIALVVSGIAQCSREETERVRVTTTATQEISRIVQRNAASSATTSDAAAELSVRTQQMQAIVAVLRSAVGGASRRSEPEEEQNDLPWLAEVPAALAP